MLKPIRMNVDDSGTTATPKLDVPLMKPALKMFPLSPTSTKLKPFKLAVGVINTKSGLGEDMVRTRELPWSCTVFPE
jgi:hypothetical protein